MKEQNYTNLNCLKLNYQFILSQMTKNKIKSFKIKQVYYLHLILICIYEKNSNYIMYLDIEEKSVKTLQDIEILKEKLTLEE